MQPIDFKESNKVLTKPEGMTDEQCSSLHVFSDGERVISCWNMSIAERFRAVFTGRVWASVWSGETSPPIKVMVETPFAQS